MAQGKRSRTNKPGGKKGKEDAKHYRLTGSKRAILLANATRPVTDDDEDAPDVVYRA